MSHTLFEQIEKDLISALKGKKDAELLILRLIKTALKNVEIAKRREKLTREDEILVLKNEAKKHLDSIELFKRGSRQDLVEKEEAELKVIRRYLPKEMSDEAIEKIVQEIITTVGAEGQKDFGMVMKEVMKKVKGRVDGKKVGEMVRNLLGE